MECIVCGEYTLKTYTRGDIEAAFCSYHLPRTKETEYRMRYRGL